MLRSAIALALMPAVLVTSSCTHVNPQVRPSDVPMTVTLRRELIRKNTYKAKPGPPTSRTRQSSTGLIDGFRGSGDLRSDLAFLAVAIIITAVIESPPSRAPQEYVDCDVQMWPLGHRTRYTQRLKWGKNKVWFPRMLNRENAPIVVRATGERKGQFLLYLPVRTDGVETLKHGNPPPAWKAGPDIKTRPVLRR